MRLSSSSCQLGWTVRRSLPPRLSHYSTAATPPTSPSSVPRHLLSISDLTLRELNALIHSAGSFKHVMKSGSIPKSLQGTLTGQTVAMMFNKRSTRTRVSTEAAVVAMGGHPMFLGKDDIQLGVNESLYDTSAVLSSMVSAIVARVGPHSDIVNLAKNSTVPVINALSDSYHPLQTIADYLTITEALPPYRTRTGLRGLRLAWVGDANNVLYDLAIAAKKLGVHLSVATPKGYEIPDHIRLMIYKAASGVRRPGTIIATNDPEEAVKGAEFIVTDTWVSMGQEAEKAKRLKDFEGFQITNDLATRGKADAGWKFMHCLPRHSEEVDDKVFYGPRSLVFAEAENRLWAALGERN
ncbi:MAG: ornithine carbamoyltransferase [Peltula sp. TS41687]|nr:MAG: ornithine carbamoyltransferase [Peltula sp. TS41687]